MLKTVMLLHIFVETVMFFQDSLGAERSKEQHLFEIEIFCNMNLKYSKDIYNVTKDCYFKLSFHQKY